MTTTTKKININPDEFKGFLPYVDAVLAADVNCSLCARAILRMKNRILHRHDADTAENKARMKALYALYCKKAHEEHESSPWRDIREVLDATDFRTISRRMGKKAADE